MNTRSLFLASIVSSTVLVALAGCGKSASQGVADALVSAGTDDKVHLSQSSGQQVTVQTAQGEAHINTGTNLPLPKDFPSDIHLPAGFAITSAAQMGPIVVIEMHTSAAMQSVYGDYDASMKSGGWTEAMAMQDSDKESVLTFRKGERNVTVSIAASSDGKGSDVHLQSTNQPN